MIKFRLLVNLGHPSVHKLKTTENDLKDITFTFSIKLNQSFKVPLLSSFCHLSNAEAALAHWCVLDSSLYPQEGQRENSQHYCNRKNR